MANFDRGRRGGGRDFNRGGFKDRGPRGPVEMHKAICDKCRKECEVPFRPTSGKPIFCSNCFKSNRGSDTRSFEGRSNDRSNNFEDRSMFDAVCDDCGNSCKVPFQPREDKPIYCSNCFGEKKGAGNRENSQSQPQFKEQFEVLNNKLDKVLQLLDPTTTLEAVESKEQLANTETKPGKKRSSKKSK
ncbi:hypothetical protein HY384_03875 [Candidatus Daviesbacteria bacterium]|nr:hypothetical protein [Candidatus Daviesbacteria bacterium]